MWDIGVGDLCCETTRMVMRMKPRDKWHRWLPRTWDIVTEIALQISLQKLGSSLYTSEVWPSLTGCMLNKQRHLAVLYSFCTYQVSYHYFQIRLVFWHKVFHFKKIYTVLNLEVRAQIFSVYFTGKPVICLTQIRVDKQHRDRLMIACNSLWLPASALTHSSIQNKRLCTPWRIKTCIFLSQYWVNPLHFYWYRFDTTWTWRAHSNKYFFFGVVAL